MIKSSLNSRHSLPKRLRFFFVFVLVFLACAVFVNIAGTVILNRKLAQVRRALWESDFMKLGVTFAYFDFFRGVSLMGTTLSEGGRSLGSIGEVKIGFDILSLFWERRILIKAIEVRGSQIAPGDISRFYPVLSQFLEQTGNRIGFFAAVYFKGSGINFDKAIEIDIRGYFSRAKGGRGISKGKIVVADKFKNTIDLQPFDYIVEFELDGGDYVLSRLECSNPIIKLTGEGRIRDAGTSPYLALEIRLNPLELKDVALLNQDRWQSQGRLTALLRVNGPLSDLAPRVRFDINGARASLFDSLVLSRMNGSFFLIGDQLISQGFSFEGNGIPLQAEMVIDRLKENPYVFLQLRSAASLQKSQVFMLRLLAGLKDCRWSGDVDARIHYDGIGSANNIDLLLKNFRLGFDDNISFGASQLQTNLFVKSLDPLSAKPVFGGNLNFNDFFCVVRRFDEGFILDYIKANGYGGTLDGRFRFAPVPGRLGIVGEAHLREANLEKFFEGFSQKPYTVSGNVSGDFRFDNSLPEMLRGQVFVTGGRVENHPLLNAVSDFFGVPSLKKLTFDELSMFFSGGRGEYSSRIKLESPQVKGLLDGKILGYETMDGYLSVSLATGLLNESKRFKKLLTYIRHDEPYVVFPFQISSYLSSPRVLWLKNEFQDKLQKLLPESNKAVLQMNVNDIVDKLEEN